MNQSSEFKDVQKIRVAVRKRPLNKKELGKNEMDIIDVKTNQTLVVKELKNKVDMTKYIEEHSFTFDHVFDENCRNEEIYVETVRPMISAAFNYQAKITVFAYGQTGSGKTFTMMGPQNQKELTIPGLYILSAYDIFNYLQDPRFSNLEIWISFYEIYCGKLYDLLNDRNVLHVREDGKQNICIVGLEEKQSTSLNSLMQIIEYGLKIRTTGSTGANNDSSRSHAVIQISIKDDHSNSAGKITFIDLAGSERAADTVNTNRQTRIDGAEINKSLLALKECIRALDQEKKHAPFRGSKLTLVLRDSFIGNCRTLMIANVSPSINNSEHTLNTLRYSDRVKELRREKSDEPMIESTNSNPSEMLAKMLMMPRQHNNTVKYKVTDRRSTLNPSKSFLKNSEYGGNIHHINNFYQPINKPNNVLNTHNDNLPSQERQQKQFYNDSNKQLMTGIESRLNNYKQMNRNTTTNINTVNNVKNINNIILTDLNSSRSLREKVNTSTENYDFSFINKPSKFSENEEILAKKLEEEKEKLNMEHIKIIDAILKEEQDFASSHRQHVDEMASYLERETLLTNDMDKAQFSIDEYMRNLNEIFNHKQKSLDSMRQRIHRFTTLLKEEDSISQKIKKISNNENYFDLTKEENLIHQDIELDQLDY